MKVQRPPERMLFGQFLLEQRYLTGNELAMALYKQSKERIHHHNTRRLGEILLQDYQVFKTKEDLDRALVAFSDYREEMSAIYNDAREIVREHVAESSTDEAPMDTDAANVVASEIGIDLGDVDIEELQGYVTAIDTFLDAADEVAALLRLKQYDRDNMIAIARKMGEIRQALLSTAPKG